MAIPTASPDAGSRFSWMAEIGIRIEIAASGLIKRELALAEHRIVYLDTRSPPTQSDDVPIVMLHGFAADKLNWVRYARHLTSRYRVVIPDLPGFGESDWHPHLVYSVRNQAVWLESLLDALGIPKAHIAGNSMGGHIATHLAIRAPERLKHCFCLRLPAPRAPVRPGTKPSLNPDNTRPRFTRSRILTTSCVGFSSNSRS
jgi:pimeloyl-ACP methyl ester carboxylesterase